MKKTTVKAKAAKPAAHATASAAKTTAKPASSAKHTTTSKHKVTTTKHKATAKHTTTKKRTLSTGDVGCCTAEALAMSLRLAGVRVADEDVLALYWHTAIDPDAGASILATLEAAWRFGLGGVRPSFDLVGDLDECCCDVARFAGSEVVDARLALRPEQLDGGAVNVGHAPHLAQHCGVDGGLEAAQQQRNAFLGHPASLILGVDLPGPHTLLATPGGLWSWGEPFNPSEWPGMVIEEAWAVSWS